MHLVKVRGRTDNKNKGVGGNTSLICEHKRILIVYDFETK